MMLRVIALWFVTSALLAACGEDKASDKTQQDKVEAAQAENTKTAQTENAVATQLPTALPENTEALLQEAQTLFNKGDYSSALAIYESIASLENARALVNMGQVYFYGWGRKADPDKARDYFRRAAEMGDGVGMFWRAKTYPRKNNRRNEESLVWFAKSLPALKSAAEAGDREAQFALGDMHFWGYDVEVDTAQARIWFHEAAKQGHVRAQEKLAYMYQHGTGGEQDFEQALHWYRKAADLHSSFAFFYLGEMYRKGMGVESDEQEAARWYRKYVEDLEKRAEQGTGANQNHLAEIYEEGKYYVPQDLVKARYWYEKAAAQGVPMAQDKLKILPML